jgi:hypothetical protein
MLCTVQIGERFEMLTDRIAYKQRHLQSMVLLDNSLSVARKPKDGASCKICEDSALANIFPNPVTSSKRRLVEFLWRSWRGYSTEWQEQICLT